VREADSGRVGGHIQGGVGANLGTFNKANDFDFEFLEPNAEGRSSVVEFSAKECEELVPFGTIYQVSQDSKVD
jgi:hypothetical protein